MYSCNEKNGSSTAKGNTTTNEQNLIIVEQDYTTATELASKENKLLFIDFYTTWCAPCKKLDELVFQNDSIKQILGRDFILLKYDAENDTVFHLSKKHHISSYPTAIVLNRKGYVVNRKYGFSGEDFQSLSENVLEFTDESADLNKQNKHLKGYSNTIDETNYPKFYNDYVNRTIKKVQPSDFDAFFKGKQNFLKEEDFTPLFYFGRNAPSHIGDIILKDKQKYFDLYGEQDVEVLLYFLSATKFNEAITEDNQEKYDQAIAFTKKALSQGWIDDILPSFEVERLKTQNNWDGVFKIYEERKNRNDISEGEINHICWDVYKNCEDQQVVAKCIDWMKELTDKDPEFAYLDTYVFLLHKSGDKKLTKEVAERALKTAKKQGKSATSLEKLLEEL
jgi:thiol-disulfide isomerase/thioredoxin